MMVSILMPAKNAAKYIVECIDSIIDQTFTNWELCVVDDHSNDHTLDLLYQKSRQDDRIRVFQNNGNGIISALSTAFEKSNGQFISRMDADDLMAPRKIELLHQALIENPNHIVTNKVKYFSEGQLNEGYLKYETWLNALVDHKNHYAEIYKECVIPSPSWMIERLTLINLGGFSALTYPEDYDLCFKLYQQKVPIVALNDTLHFWRDYPNRTSRTDRNYSDNSFLELKVKYFIRCDYKANQPLILWGAGKKGKRIAQLLKDSKIAFRWVTNNSSKLNVPIYDIKLESDSILEEVQNCQVILAIAERGFKSQKQEEAHHFFKFC